MYEMRAIIRKVGSNETQRNNSNREDEHKKQRARTQEQKVFELREQINIKQRIIGIAFHVREIFQLAQIHCTLHTHTHVCGL